MARSGGDCGDKAQVLARLPEIRIAMTYGEDGLQHMLLNGEDVTKAIRENAVSGYASLVSAYPEVRAFLLDMQRELARTHNVIMDGRDIGTVVLPGADVKVFLTASPEERAKRRCRELEQRGQPVDYRQLLEEITQRDAAPLKQAEDALLLDTSALDFDASLEALLAIVKERVPL